MKYPRGNAQMASALFANLLEPGNRHAGGCGLPGSVLAWNGEGWP